jgi:hypothetical protein
MIATLFLSGMGFTTFTTFNALLIREEGLLPRVLMLKAGIHGYVMAYQRFNRLNALTMIKPCWMLQTRVG